MADRYAIIRSVTHRDNDHAIGAYLALTGHSHPKHDILGIEPPASPQDMPSIGSVVASYAARASRCSPYVTLGDLRHFGNNDSMGQNAGCLGKAYDPFTVPFVRPINGSARHRRRPVADGPGGRPAGELGGAGGCSDELTAAPPPWKRRPSMRNLDDCTPQAYELLASPASRDAFDLEQEPRDVRDALRPHSLRPELPAGAAAGRGGRADGHRLLGRQSRLGHARRQFQVPEEHVAAADATRGCRRCWKTLSSRGMLDETLVVWMGDMGRTPRINKAAGRDHWSFCYSIVMAGGGVRGGQVYGASDRTAAYPSTNPVSPADVAATIYHCLGIDPRGQVRDQQGRPLVIGVGKPIQGIL